MRDIVKTTLSLIIICFAVSLCLAFVNNVTKDTIAERAKSDAEEQRRQVMAKAESFKEVSGWQEKDSSGMIREAYAAYAGDKLIGYVFSAAPKGYGGEIRVTIGITSDRAISGVKVGDNKETPGLGTKTAESSFTGQYLNKNIQTQLEVVKRAPTGDNQIEAVSGATISSRAVTGAVQAAATLGQKLLEEGGSAK